MPWTIANGERKYVDQDGCEQVNVSSATSLPVLSRPLNSCCYFFHKLFLTRCFGVFIGLFTGVLLV